MSSMLSSLTTQYGRSKQVNKNVVLTESGRAPWYSTDGKPKDAFIIGIAGGSSSGKTRVASEILKALNVPWALIVAQDNFYKSLTPEQSKAAFRNEYDFDCPDAFDTDVLIECVKDLKACRACQIPTYSFRLHQRQEETSYLYGGSVVIVEGIFALHDPRLRDLFDLKVFVQCDPDIMLARRIRRDLVERGRDPEGILDQYLRYVKPSFDNSVSPTQKFADVIVPGMNNERSVHLITQYVKSQIEDRSMMHRSELSKVCEDVMPPTPGINGGGSIDGLPDNVFLIDETNQVKGMHTILRNVNTSREDFIHFTTRLSALIAEQALALLPYRAKAITTGTNLAYEGQELAVDPGHLCAVSILRSGAVLEKGLRRVIPEVAIGSMLIQSESVSGEPLLYSVKLPRAITTSASGAVKSWVLLLDSQIGTGASAVMAIRILLDHGVPEDQILFCTILVSRVGGVWAIKRAFPGVRIVTSAADPNLKETFAWEKDPFSDESGKGDRLCYPKDESRSSSRRAAGTGRQPSSLGGVHPDHAARKRIYQIVPGLGSIGDRYFGA